METLCWAQGSSAGPAPAPATLAHGITTEAPAMLTMRHTTSFASVPLDTRVRARAGTGQQGPPTLGMQDPSTYSPLSAGPRCDRCSPGYFGAPEMEGGECRPCQCNNNIDASDPEGCDPRTGQCLRCLYHTAGPRCAQCQPGYYGNALQRSCRRERGEGSAGLGMDRGLGWGG